jgi:hypothetical protein
MAGKVRRVDLFYLKVLYRVLVGKPEGKGNLEDPDLDGKILKLISSKSEGMARTGLIWFRIGTSSGLL